MKLYIRFILQNYAIKTHTLFLIELRQCVVCRENRYPGESDLFFCGSFVLLLSWVFHAFAPQSVHCCLVVTCWEKADLLALVCDVFCVFVAYPCGILGQVWYLIVSIPDLCHLSYSISTVQCAIKQVPSFANLITFLLIKVPVVNMQIVTL